MVFNAESNRKDSLMNTALSQADLRIQIFDLLNQDTPTVVLAPSELAASLREKFGSNELFHVFEVEDSSKVEI